VAEALATEVVESPVKYVAVCTENGVIAVSNFRLFARQSGGGHKLFLQLYIFILIGRLRSSDGVVMHDSASCLSCTV